MLENKITVAISSDFFGAFAALPRAQQTKVSRFVERFKAQPATNGFNYETINNARDRNLRSVRIDNDYRGIVLKPETGNVYVLLWVDKHDDAYRWAEKKLCKVNPESGSLQIVSAETVEAAPVESAASPTPAGGRFEALRDRELLRLGVPEEMLPRVRNVGTDAELDSTVRDLPQEAAEALYMLAMGYSLQEALIELEKAGEPPAVDTQDFAAALANVDSRRRFYVVEDERELAAMLNAPLEQWRIFLHPSQRRLAERDWSGPVRVLGGAGTGKTVVAMHRAKWLAENRFTGASDRILFTTFTRNLAADIRENLAKLCPPATMARIEVINIDAWVRDFLGRNGYRHKILYDDGTEDVWRLALTVAPATPALSPAFYREEWAQVIQPQGITEMAAYLTAPRLGRGTAISRKERAAIWPVFEEYRTLLNERSSKEFDDAVRDARILLEGKGDVLPYRCVIVDEAQDMADEVFRLIRQIVPASESGKNDLFIVGDGHQQIYRRSVTLGRCGINIRGRSRKLRINYRTTDETCRWATALLTGVPVADLDDGADDQRGYRSLMHGDDPQHRHFVDFDAEVAGIAEHLKSLGDQGTADTCLVLRTQALLERYEAALRANGVAVYRISRNSPDDRREPGVRLATMHRVKGLQFEHMIVVAANADILPLASAVGAASDPAGRRDAEYRERRLLYVAATRAKRSVMVTSYGKPSSFLNCV